MKIFKIILLCIIGIVILVFLGGTVFISYISHRCLPDYNSEIKLNNITEPVVVYRDSFAIPHIYANNETDLYTAVGYVLAQDRLWQMDLLRRATFGKLSEIFGDDFIDVDWQLRSLRIPEKSERVIKETDTTIMKCMIAFSNGVNQYIDENINKLPVEFIILGYKPEKWEPLHSFNLIGYMAWDLTSGWEAEIVLNKLKKILNEEKFKILIPDLNLQLSYIYPGSTVENSTIENLSGVYKNFEKLDELGLKVFCGSNNWAVSAKKSATGKPVLANDMHLGLFAPGIWCQMHQVVKNKLDVTGVVLPGQPFVISGHNDSIAWGLTNVMLDDIDFYLETLNEDSTKYLLNGEWRDLIVKTTDIKSKSGKTCTKTIRFTHRGPVISQFKDIAGEVISMHWLGSEFSNELRSMYLLNRANNRDDFEQAMNTFNSTSQNVVYADMNDNIGLYCCAGIPIRKGNGIFILPGDTDLFDWQGLVPFENRPHTYNPDQGYLISANNNTVPNYPYHISHWFHQPARYNRIKELIEKTEKLSIVDHTNIQTDFTSPYAVEMNSKFLDSLYKIEDFSAREKELLSSLSIWDGNYLAENIAPTIFETLHSIFIKNIITDELGEVMYKEFLKEKTLYWSAAINLFNNPSSPWYDDINTIDKQENYQDILKKSFTETVEFLTENYGRNAGKWQWGDVHGMVLKHPMGSVSILNRLFNLNTKTYKVGGTYHTVCPYSFNFGKLFDVNHGASERHVYSLANWDESLTVIPTGTSGIPVSMHYCDQTKLYANSFYHADYISLKLIEKTALYKQVFNPE